MREQNYKNHRKYYAPHHFIFMPLTFILLGYGIWKSIQNEDSLVWILFSICIFLILFAGTMLRQHYALGNQNRIIRLEFRQRYFEIFGKSADEVLKHLTFDQIAALRFAYDDEFKTLLNRAITEKASGDKLKRSITNWKPDHNRV